MEKVVIERDTDKKSTKNTTDSTTFDEIENDSLVGTEFQKFKPKVYRKELHQKI